MIEDALRECLALGVTAEQGGEAEGLRHRQVGADYVEGSSSNLFLLVHRPSALV